MRPAAAPDPESAPRRAVAGAFFVLVLLTAGAFLGGVALTLAALLSGVVAGVVAPPLVPARYRGVAAVAGYAVVLGVVLLA